MNIKYKRIKVNVCFLSHRIPLAVFIWARTEGTYNRAGPSCSLRPCSSECGPWTSSTDVTWELLRRAEPQAAPGPTPNGIVFYHHPQVIPMRTGVWKVLLQWTHLYTCVLQTCRTEKRSPEGEQNVLVTHAQCGNGNRASLNIREATEQSSEWAQGFGHQCILALSATSATY